MELKALYLLDLKYPAKDGNFIFKYNPQNGLFEMEIDKTFSYSPEEIFEDENWMLFEIFKEDDENAIVKRITVPEAEKMILIFNIMSNKLED